MRGIEVIHGDCHGVLAGLSLPSRVAVVTDPPYGVNWKGTGSKSGILAQTTRFVGVGIVGDDKPFDPSPWLQFSHVILWGANHYADRLPPRAQWLIWDKRDGITSNDLADCELAWTNGTGPARLFCHRWMGMLKQSERGKPRVHPTQKPVAVMAWCLQFVPDDYLILDPYAGSGSTLVACAKAGRRAVGIELDERYIPTIHRRLAECETPIFDAFETAAAP